MKLMLDTHIVLWAAGDPDRLPARVRALIEDKANGVYFSVASLWEIVIKRGLGRDDFEVDPVKLRRLLVANGLIELDVTADHVLAVDGLPPLHRDPFDRLLVAQAQHERLVLVTADRQLPGYGSGIMMV